MIILPCPKRPDLDCIAGAVAYAEYLTHIENKPARAWICGVPDGEAQFYLDLYSSINFASDADVAAAKEFVLVDFSVKFILPPQVDPLKVTQVIDHRFFTDPATDFPHAAIQIDGVGAAATQIAEYYMKAQSAPSPHSAAMLYGAIYTHTLCLQSETTTERDKAAVAWLKTYVPDADELVRGQLDRRVHEIISQMPSILKTEMKIETSRFGAYGFTLLELRDAETFWQRYKQDIMDWAASCPHPVVVDIIDPMANRSIFYCADPDYGAALEHILNPPARDHTMHTHPAWFRKQIIPLLKGDMAS